MGLPPEGTYGVQTNNHHYLTAVNGGGLKGTTSGYPPVAFNSNATRIGPFETFTWIWLDQESGSFALQTESGNYVTAVNGGGVGGPNNEDSPFHTDATWYRQWEEFYIQYVDESQNKIALRTVVPHYVTAVNGGGIGGPNNSPNSILHTDAIQIRAWETFFLYTPR